MSRARSGPRARLSTWIRRWRPVLPLLAAEFILLLGFGALLPVLPLFVQDQGIDAFTLGLIMAAWPIGKLIFEPVFGWWADRRSRKPQMALALVVFGGATLLMLFASGAAALFALRFVTGVAAGAYDPAARGMLVAATADDERGEAFGIYGAFQMGGFVFGPAIGAFAAVFVGGFAVPFILTGVLSVAAAAVIALRLDEDAHVVEDPAFERHPDAQPLPAGPGFSAADRAVVPGLTEDVGRQAPLAAMWNRLFLAALLLQFGIHLSFAVYEVVWSLYLVALGATLGLVGITFMLLAIPEIIVSPLAGRAVDRRGPVRIIVSGATLMLASGVLYAIATEPILPAVVILFAATGGALILPAISMMVARATPVGRTSTAQGIFGATGTLALIVASIVAGFLFELGIGLPFWFFVVGFGICTVAALLVLRGARSTRTPLPEPQAV